MKYVWYSVIVIVRTLKYFNELNEKKNEKSKSSAVKLFDIPINTDQI